MFISLICTKKQLSFFIGCIIATTIAHAQMPRGSSEPFISGDTFRSFAHYIFDEIYTDFDTRKVTRNDIIFVKTDRLPEFFTQKHPFIMHPYILITHNSDLPAPGVFHRYLDDPKVIAWFAQNVEHYTHPKLLPIPIGIGNKQWEHGSVEVLQNALTYINSFERSNVLYMNFSTGTHKDRASIYHYFKNFPGICPADSKSFGDYLKDLAHTQFVLSPRGNGLDCHRTWEALYMGAVPIVQRSSLDSLYEGLPVIIVNSWSEITPEYLENQWHTLRSQSFITDKLYSNYWRNLINSYKRI